MIKTKAYLNEFLNFYNYPEDAKKAFNYAYGSLKDNENLNFLLENFYKNKEQVSGEPFNKQARFAAYNKAYHFFNDVLGKNIDTFACGSWLLYDKNREILDEKSNIVDFMNDFNILGSWEYKDPWHDMWRIFGKYGNGPAENLPRNTSLQRAYADFILGGGIPGGSKGVFVWDDVNKTTLK